MKVYDPATPSRAGYQIVRINVNRNVRAPRFGQGIYYINIADDSGRGYKVIQFNATDDDGVGVFFSSLSF